MGTRSMTTVMEGESPLVRIYRQMDGYPSGHGLDIMSAMNGGNCTVVNGYQRGMENPTHFNGMGCLAAHLIHRLKGESGIGGIYISSDNDPECEDSWLEYHYVLWGSEDAGVFIDVREYRDGAWHSAYRGPLIEVDMKTLG